MKEKVKLGLLRGGLRVFLVRWEEVLNPRPETHSKPEP